MSLSSLYRETGGSLTQDILAQLPKFLVGTQPNRWIISYRGLIPFN